MEMYVVWGVSLALLGWIVVCALRRSSNVRGAVLVSTLAVASLAINTNVPRGASSLGINFITAFLIIGLVTPRQNIWRHKVRSFVFAWFAIFLLTTSLANPDGVNALLQFSLLAMMVVMIASKMGPQDRSVFVGGLVLLGAVHSLLSIREYAGQQPWLWGYGKTLAGADLILPNPFFGSIVPRAQSTMGHPIAAATLVAASLLTLLLHRKSFRPIFFGALFFILLTGVLLTGTRSVVLGIGLALAFYYLVSSESRYKAVKYVTTAAIVGAFLTLDLGVSKLVGELVDSGSYTNRAGALESVPMLFTRAPEEVFWGSGFGSEARLFSEGFFQQNGFNIVDNQMVTTLATGGVIGLSGLCAIYVYAFVTASAYVRTTLIFMATMLFSFDYFRWHAIFLLFFVFIGMSSSMKPAGLTKAVLEMPPEALNGRTRSVSDRASGRRPAIALRSTPTGASHENRV